MVFRSTRRCFTVRHSQRTGTGGVLQSGIRHIRGNLRVGQALEKVAATGDSGRWLMIYWQGKETPGNETYLPLILALVAGMAQADSNSDYGPVLILLTRSKDREAAVFRV